MPPRLTRPLTGLALAAASLAPAAAHAQDSAYCRRVRAEAASEAARLMTPRLVLQGLRFPSGLSGLPLTGADGAGSDPFQARAGLAFEPLELVKGVELLRAAEEDCEAQAARVELEGYAEHGEEAARLPALRAQVAFLREQEQRWKALVTTQEQAFAGHAITVFELNQVRHRALLLERRLAQATGEAERLAARGYRLPQAPVPVVADRWRRHALLLEGQRAGVRGLSAWNLRFTGGVVASSQAPDWYGLAEFSVHLGAFAQDGFDRRALQARADELRTEQGGVERRATEVEAHLRLLAAQARQELSLVEEQLSSLGATRASLERAEAPNATWAAALLATDELLAEAERAYLAALVEALSTLLKEKTP